MNILAYQEFQKGLEEINAKHKADLAQLLADRINKINTLWSRLAGEHPDWDTSLMDAYYSLGSYQDPSRSEV